MDLKPEHASALKKQLTTHLWEQARQGQEATILRPSSENIGSDLSSIIHQVAMSATPPQDSYHHQTDTADVQTDVPSCHFQASSLLNNLAYGVYWRSRAGELLPVRRWRRRPVDAQAQRMRHEGDVSIKVSGNPEFRERTIRSNVRRIEVSNRQQTNYLGNHEKAPTGRGGSDEAIVVQGQGRTRDGGTAPIGSAGPPTRGGRTSARAKKYSHLVGRGSESKRSRNWQWNGTYQFVDPTASPR